MLLAPFAHAADAHAIAAGGFAAANLDVEDIVVAADPCSAERLAIDLDPMESFGGCLEQAAGEEA